VKPK
jgi:hypothetical protein